MGVEWVRGDGSGLGGGLEGANKFASKNSKPAASDAILKVKS